MGRGQQNKEARPRRGEQEPGEARKMVVDDGDRGNGTAATPQRAPMQSATVKF